MNSRLYTARQALKLGVALGAFSTFAAFGQLADANVSEAAALHARMRPLAAKLGSDLSDIALARALGIDVTTLRGAGAPSVGEFAPGALLFGGPGSGPDLSTLDADQARTVNAGLPFAADPVIPARPFALAGAPADRQRALDCLTKAVYYEASSEGPDGERAVAQVVLNRVRNVLFPHSVCGVVFQGAELSTGCQFSFTCDGSLGRQPVAWAWDRARQVASAALHGQVFAPVGLATHYHADYVAPYWMTSVSKVAQIGQHIFYRWPGALGLPQAFTARYAGVEKLAPSPVPAPAPELLAGSEAGLTLAAASTGGVHGPDGRVHDVLQVASATPPSAVPASMMVRPNPAALAAVEARLAGAGSSAPAAEAAPAPPAPAKVAEATTPAAAAGPAAAVAAPAEAKPAKIDWFGPRPGSHPHPATVTG